MRIVHVITTTDVGGGAERALQRLARGLQARGHDQRVISLLPTGGIGRALQADGVQVGSLGLAGGSPRALASVPQLRRRIRGADPDLVQTWLYHADLLGVLATRGGPPLCWNVRAHPDELFPPDGTRPNARRGARWVFRACAAASRLPTAVVINAERSREAHARRGFRPRRWEVIPNGIDLDGFTPSAQAGPDLRATLGIDRSAPLVGMVARWHPVKDHACLAAALARVARTHRDVQLVLVGPEIDRANLALLALLDQTGIADRTHLLGVRADLPALYPAFDVLCLTSRSEGFPNVIAEAMACGVPVVSTDVGAAAEILGDTGIVAPVADADAIARGVCTLLEEAAAPRTARRARCRERIRDRFTLDAVVDRYEALYRALTSSS